jgi:hypothetical protein
VIAARLISRFSKQRVRQRIDGLAGADVAALEPAICLRLGL